MTAMRQKVKDAVNWQQKNRRKSQIGRETVRHTERELEGQTRKRQMDLQTDNHTHRSPERD